MAAEEKPKRLCSEIQLFDLCDKAKCARRDGRFCMDEELLNRFEAISQEEDFPAEQYLVDETEEHGEEDEAYPGFGDDFDDSEEDAEEDY